MKKVEFTHINADNFGRFTSPIQHKLGHRVIVSGANGVGKSTVKRMFQYILGTRDENGKEISGIRPHDENGVDIDGLITVAELGISVDGLKNTLKKTYFQKKNRQGEYTGENDTQYFIDDVKKGTKKAYDEFVSGFLPSMVCISAQELLMKDTAGRRAMLEVFSKHDTDSIIDENKEFEPLRVKLKANTVADLKKACRDSIKAKTKERDGYPARIDEVEKQKVDIDLAELELHRNALNEQIAENKAKQADVSKQFEEYDNLSKGVLELKFELNGLQQKANKELEKQRGDIGSEQWDCQKELDRVEQQIKLNKQDIERAENAIKRNEEQRQIQLTLWNRANERTFDESSLICPYCCRPYEKDKQEEMRLAFDSNKADELKSITDKGTELKSAIAKDKVEIEQLKATLAENEKLKSELETRISELETQYNTLPQSIDISDRQDVKEINRQIAEKEAAIKQGNSASEIRQQLQDDGEELQRQLNEVEKQFDKAENNNRIDERVAQLTKEQRDLSQKIADIERELDLLKQFERKKAELLESDVNSNFEFVQFRMFEPQVNGDLKDVCLITVNGESYDRNLNFSNRLLAEVDICRGFQRKFDVQLPILLDNAESIDKGRIPNIPNQLILFERTDSKELRIEVV